MARAKAPLKIVRSLGEPDASRVVGIDFDTKAVYLTSILEDDPTMTVRLDEVRLLGDYAFERIRSIRETLVEVLGSDYWDDVAYVGIEDPRATNPLMRSVIGLLARVQGGIFQAIPRRVLVEPFNAKEWRVAVGLSGNATKDDVAAWAVEKNGTAGLAQDFYDATAIARAAVEYTEGRWVRPPKKTRRKKLASGGGES